MIPPTMKQRSKIIRTSFQTLITTPTNQWNGIKVKTLIMKALDGDPKKKTFNIKTHLCKRIVLIAQKKKTITKL
jgi:hypothetical protein